MADAQPINAGHEISARDESIEKRLDDLTARGVVVGNDGPRAFLRPVTRRRGALERFLAERR